MRSPNTAQILRTNGSSHAMIKTPVAVSYALNPETVAPSHTLPTLHQFFAPGGLLSQAHPNYEFRRGQLQMAEAGEQALANRKHLIVEAGTRTGKPLAYMRPVI